MEKEVEEKIEEGMFPELGGKKIRIGDKEYLIVEMPVFYTKQLQRLLKPIVGTFLNQKNTLALESLIDSDNIDKALNAVVEPAYFIMNYHYPDIFSDNDIFIKTKGVSERTCLNIIHSQLEANGIIDFFKQLLESVLRMTATHLVTMTPPKSE